MRHFEQTPVVKNLPQPSETKAGIAIIAVHGRNQTPEFMEQILSRLGWEKSPVVYPVAVDKSWYPGGFMESFDINKSQFEDAIVAISNAQNFLNERGFQNEEIVLLGFSQGACLISHYALRYPDKYFAVISFTGGYIGHVGLDWKFEGDFSQTPVFISTSKIDEWVPVGRVLETEAQFRKLNADVSCKIYENRIHEVCDDEIAQVKKLIAI